MVSNRFWHIVSVVKERTPLSSRKALPKPIEYAKRRAPCQQRSAGFSPCFPQTSSSQCDAQGVPAKPSSAKQRSSYYERGMALRIPQALAASCGKTPERQAWLDRLPETLRELQRRWSLTLQAPFDTKEVSCSYVAAAVLADGTYSVLKIGMPHMEGEHEIHGLRFWNGNPTVRLLMADDNLNAMLLERCEPGTALRALPECEQDVVIARLLNRLWRSPSAQH